MGGFSSPESGPVFCDYGPCAWLHGWSRCRSLRPRLDPVLPVLDDRIQPPRQVAISPRCVIATLSSPWRPLPAAVVGQHVAALPVTAPRRFGRQLGRPVLAVWRDPVIVSLMQTRCSNCVDDDRSTSTDDSPLLVILSAAEIYESSQAPIACVFATSATDCADYVYWQAVKTGAFWLVFSCIKWPKSRPVFDIVACNLARMRLRACKLLTGMAPFFRYAYMSCNVVVCRC